MEPRSFNRGDVSQNREITNDYELQWSHGRLTVVTRLIFASYIRYDELQWSHGRLTVVTLAFLTGSLSPSPLQWSHGRLTVVTRSAWP